MSDLPFVYIEINNMHFNVTENTIILDANWTPPGTLTSPKDVYINVTPNKYLLQNSLQKYIANTIQSKTNNIFSQYKYKLVQDQDGKYIMQLY